MTVIPLRAAVPAPLVDRLYQTYEAARADLERRWPNVGVEDLRRVVAAFDAFQSAMR